MKLWERRKGESAKAFAAFVVYRDMGPERSIDQAWGRYQSGINSVSTRAPGQWRMWCVDHEWVARAQAYADFLDRIDGEEYEREARGLAKRMAKRHLAHRERKWELRDALSDVAEELLANTSNFYETKESYKPGKKAKLDDQGRMISPPEPGERTITIALNAAAMLIAIEVAMKLGDEAIGTDTGVATEGVTAVEPEPMSVEDALRQWTRLLRQAREELEREQQLVAGDGDTGITEAG